MPDPISAILGVGTIGSTLIGASSASKAANAQEKAANRAADVQLEMYNQTRSDLQPYAMAGRPALRSVLGMYGLRPGATPFNDQAIADFEKSPDYQIAYREGLRALDNTAAARGTLKSGGTIKGAMQYASDLGTRKLDDYMANLMRISGMGQNAAAGQGSAAMQTGSNLARSYLDAGEAQAAGIVGMGNALGSGLSNLSSNIMFQQMMKNPSAYRTSLPSIY